MGKKSLIKRPVAEEPEQRRLGSFIPVFMSILSLCVALTSLLISYKNYRHSQTEELSVTVFPRSSNDSAHLFNLSAGSYLLTVWDVLFTNVGDRPLSVVRYEIREQLPSGSFVDGAIIATFYDERDSEVLLPFTLQPAESKLIRVTIPLRPVKAALEILEEELDDAETSWGEVTTTLFWRSIDIYGNKYRLVQVPGRDSWVHELEPPFKQQHFRFVFTSGRGKEFETVASLYGRTAPRIIGR